MRRGQYHKSNPKIMFTVPTKSWEELLNLKRSHETILLRESNPSPPSLADLSLNMKYVTSRLNCELPANRNPKGAGSRVGARWRRGVKRSARTWRWWCPGRSAPSLRGQCRRYITQHVLSSFRSNVQMSQMSLCRAPFLLNSDRMLRKKPLPFGYRLQERS